MHTPALQHFSIILSRMSLIFLQPQTDEAEDDDAALVLAFSLGNRSACSFRMEMYREAIQDIQVALSLNYPRESTFKLYERLARCWMALRQKDQALNALEHARKLGLEQTAQLENLTKELLSSSPSNAG